MVFGLNAESILAAIAAAAFGCGYALVVRRMRAELILSQYITLMVVGGVMVTALIALPFIGMQAAVTLGILFFLTGTPMVVEDVQAKVELERAERESLRREVNNDAA